MPRTAPTPSRARRGLVALALAAASLAGTVGLGTAPANAGAPSFCDGDQAKAFICRTYLYYLRRNMSQAELDYWAPQMPGRKTVMIASVGRSGESRRRIIEEYYDHFTDRDAGDADKTYWEAEVLAPNGFRRLEAALLAEIPGTPEEFVSWAFQTLLGRGSSGTELSYWVGHAEAKGYNLTAAALAFTSETRRLRARSAYLNHFEEEPDEATVAYWAQRLRTGLSYLDLRIALWAASYPTIGGPCMPLRPPNGPGCV